MSIVQSILDDFDAATYLANQRLEQLKNVQFEPIMKRLYNDILHKGLRENFKYYFADFVRKGGTPPPPLGIFSGKKGVTDLGGTPLPP